MSGQTESLGSIVYIARFYNIPTAGDLTGIQPEGNPVDFPEVIGFKYFESINESFSQARLTVYDSAGEVDRAFNKCGCRQFCPVEIALVDPSNGKDWERGRSSFEFLGDNCFYVDKVSKQLVEGKKKMYTLKLIRKDALVAMNTTIKSALPPDSSTKVDYNAGIDLAMTKYVKTTKALNITEELSESVAKLMGNGRKVYQYINHICSKATPKLQSSGKEETRSTGYVFYETYQEYRFQSIIRLMTEPFNLDPGHGVYNVGVVNNDQVSDSEASYTILSYNFYEDENQASLLEESAAGKRGKKEKRVLDIARNKFKKIEKLPAEITVDPCLKAASDGQLTDITTVEESEYQIEFYKVCESDALDNEPTNPNLTSLNYPATLALLKGQVASLRIPGNLALSAGDHVALSFPEIKADSGKGVELSDKYSGNYLITQLSHRVEDINHLYTHLSVVKLIKT